MSPRRSDSDQAGPAIEGVPVFVDQDGVAWRRDHGECPRCREDADYRNRVPVSGYFRCSACGLVFDEPTWRDPESAFAGTLDD